jgi:SsrA-binding protein
MPKVLAKNRRATFDYELIKKYEAGLLLKGIEVKSIKDGHASLKGSFVSVYKDELYLTNANIPPYKFAGNPKDYDPLASRKLLLHKKEIKYLLGKSKTEGLTMIPLSLYTSKNKVKLKFALARGKKKYDKRETLKKRSAQREIDRKLKSRF